MIKILVNERFHFTRIGSKNDHGVPFSLHIANHIEFIRETLRRILDNLAPLLLTLEPDMHSDRVSPADSLQERVDEPLREQAGLEHGRDAVRVPVLELGRARPHQFGEPIEDLRVFDESLADHVRQDQSDRAVESAEEGLVVGDPVDLGFGGEEDGIGDDVGDVRLVVETDDFWGEEGG